MAKDTERLNSRFNVLCDIIKRVGIAMLSTIAPFGVGLFAIAAIVYIYIYIYQGQPWVAVLALCLVTIIYFVEKFTTPKNSGPAAQ
jgi:hypothetical protein